MAGPSGPAFLYHFYPRSPCGERRYSLRHSAQSWHFYPRSPCGERRPLSAMSSSGKVYFYPRSPCGERHNTHTYRVYCPAFLSTLSLRRATWPGLLARPFFIISIHALLAESDCQWRRSVKLFRQFLSTLSLRRATIDTSKDVIKTTSNFYPRSPCGERLRKRMEKDR